MSAPRDSLIELLGLPKDQPWSWAAADAEATASSEALNAFEALLPLVDGYGLADYLRNLATAVAQMQADYETVRDSLDSVYKGLMGGTLALLRSEEAS